MTDLAVRPFELARARTSPLLIVAAGLLGGLSLGIAARAWMRLISEEPEFSWSGTLFIVIAFTIFGFTQSIAAVARCWARRRSTLTIARVLATVGMLPLFVGAGAVMMPTVVGGGLATARTDWPRLARVIGALVATGPVIVVGAGLVDSFGWSVHSAAGIIGLLALYGTIIGATKFAFSPQQDGWRLNRTLKAVVSVLVGLLLAFLVVGLMGARN